MNPEGLHDIVTPAAISWLPQTAGWAIVGLVVAALGVRWAWLRYRRWLSNAYRRDALVELSTLEESLGDPASRARALSSLPALVKRVAIAAAPRATVASLSDSAWLDFLDATARRPAFGDGPGSLLPTLAYAAPDRLGQIPDPDVHALLRLVEEWIRTHEIPDPPTRQAS